MSREAACACAGQGDGAPLNRGVRGGDRLVQQLECLRVQERGEREGELQLHVGLLACRRRRLGERAPQIRCRCLRRSSRGGAPRRIAQRRHRRRLAGRFGAEQVQGDPLRFGALAHEQRGSLGMLSRPRTRRHAGVEGSSDQRMRERQLGRIVEHAGGAERVGGAGGLGELQPGERGGVTKGGARTEHGDRPRQRGSIG